MRLTEVLPADIAPPPGADAVHVTGITAASAAVGPGAIFAGIPGSKIDGTAFVADAIARGAAAVVVARGKGVAVPAGVVLIEVENPRAALAKIAAKFAAKAAALRCCRHRYQRQDIGRGFHTADFFSARS